MLILIIKDLVINFINNQDGWHKWLAVGPGAPSRTLLGRLCALWLPSPLLSPPAPWFMILVDLQVCGFFFFFKPMVLTDLALESSVIKNTDPGCGPSVLVCLGHDLGMAVLKSYPQ